MHLCQKKPLASRNSSINKTHLLAALLICLGSAGAGMINTNKRKVWPV